MFVSVYAVGGMFACVRHMCLCMCVYTYVYVCVCAYDVR